jgi:pectin methylesterase-like acyl-CoA thioesterase
MRNFANTNQLTKTITMRTKTFLRTIMATLLVVLGVLEAGATTYPITATWSWKSSIPSGIGTNTNFSEGNTGYLDSDVSGIQLYVDATNNGKLKNNGDCAQFNTGTKLHVPVGSTTDVVTVVAHAYNFANIKIGGTVYTTLTTEYTAKSADVSLGYVEIESTASPYLYSIQVVQNEPEASQSYTTIYNLATAMMGATSNFEGNSGTLAPMTTVEGSNAPEIQVDATNGKLGKNNADWAQINEGTVLTLPGVPKGATLTFVLYDATALTIDGIAYTNGQTYTATKDKNVQMTCTTGSYIKTITVVGSPFVTIDDSQGYTNTWHFGKSNGAEEFALQKSAEYVYTVNEYPLTINTDAGKLNNASRNDQWAQCNNGTTFKVPVFEGAKLTWGTYKTGSEVGFTIDGRLFNTSYVATADGTVSMTASGIEYLSSITIQPIELYTITGTITGGTIDGASITLTANDNGQAYTATVAEGAFTLKVPIGTYIPSLGGDVAFVISEPASVTASEAGSIGAITITAAQAQTVTGQITNAPAEAFTLTFTGGSHNKQVELEAGATSYSTTLDPDTYTISSNVGTLSPLSQESFKVLTGAVSHNIYYPEAAIPAATQQEITVDNTAAVAANVYNTVTDALAAAKAGNISAPVITLTSGQTYREQVIVDLANVTLKTSGDEKATITWYYGIGYAYYSLGSDGYYNKDRAMTRNSIKMVNPARWGATVLVKNTGNGFKAENIIFENSFNQYYTAEEVADGVIPNGVEKITYNRQLTNDKSGYKEADTKAVTERACAIGFENNPTGCQLYNCVFRGSQDTFYSSGKLYVKNCNIIGNTDYIFGGGYVVFDDCDLTIGGYSDQSATAYITASNGGTYVFRDCTVKAGDRQYVAANLGRDWGGTNANVYYLNLKNEIGNKLTYKWTNMGGAVTAGTANLHIYDFDPTVNANYNTTGASGANVNGTLTAAQAEERYTEAVTQLGFTPEQIYDITLDENIVYNDIRIAAANGGTGDVTITRNIAAGQWNTLCLPFSMTAAQVTETFGMGTKLANFTSYDATTKELTMTSATDITAGQPCMIWVGTAVSEAKTISGVTYSSADPVVTQNGVTFQGTYQSGNIPAGAYFVSANNLYQSTGSSTIKPFRAYFTAPAGARLLFVDEATAISTINNTTRHDVYDLQGRKVNSQPRKGLYIVDGKKHTIK